MGTPTFDDKPNKNDYRDVQPWCGDVRFDATTFLSKSPNGDLKPSLLAVVRSIAAPVPGWN